MKVFQWKKVYFRKINFQKLATSSIFEKSVFSKKRETFENWEQAAYLIFAKNGNSLLF